MPQNPQGGTAGAVLDQPPQVSSGGVVGAQVPVAGGLLPLPSTRTPKHLRGSRGVWAEQLWGQAASSTFRAAFKPVSFCSLTPIYDPAHPLSINTANAACGCCARGAQPSSALPPGSLHTFSRDGFTSPASALHGLRDTRHLPLMLRTRSRFFIFISFYMKSCKRALPVSCHPLYSQV